MMASQTGKTLCLNLDCEYIIHHLKQSLLMVRPTIEAARDWMRGKFIPTTQATPCMNGLLSEPRKKGANSTGLNRRFPGGAMRVIGANSVSSFRSDSLAHVRQDEIDAYKESKEGDPCALADRATKTFSNATKVKSSTCTLKGFSRIESGFDSGDKEYYFQPCPCCGHFQWLKTEQNKFSFTGEEIARFEVPGFHPNQYTWEIGNLPVKDTKKAIYVCESCNRGWTDQQRIEGYLSGHAANPPVMVNGIALRAEWRATAPFNGILSMAVNCMIVTMGIKPGFVSYLHQFAEEFLEAKRGGREKFMAWTNMSKNEPFEDAAQKVEWKDVKARAEDYQVFENKNGDLELELPMGAVFPCFSVDVQIEPPRVEIASYAWGVGEEVWSMDYKVIHGDFDMPDMRDRVEAYLLGKRFHHPVLGEIGFEAGTFDSGKQTKVYAVYKICAQHRLNNWYACKGYDQALGSVYRVKKEKRFGGLILDINTDYMKTLIYDRLKNTEPGPRYIHYPKESIETTLRGQPATLTTPFNDRFFRMLCSEKRVFKGKAFHWVKPTSGTRNEGLDTTVYAFAVYEMAKQEGKIAKLTEEAKKLSGQKDYVIKPAEKMPELKQVTIPSRAPVNPNRRPMQRPMRGPGGMFNPLGI